MAKKKSRKRNQVNWSNPKVKNVVSFLALAENRMEKKDIFAIGNKDIFYQLKNSGYIKETAKDVFIGTNKLLKREKASDGRLFSSSSSMEHSEAVKKTLYLLPKQVIEQKHFHTAKEIEKQFNQKQKNTALYQHELSVMQHDCKRKLSNLQRAHKDFFEVNHSAVECFYETVSYNKQSEELFQQLRILEDKPYLTPDYQITLTKSELNEYLETLHQYTDTLEPYSKERAVYSDAVNKLTEHFSQLGETECLTLNVEIITNSYGNRELIMHQNFEHFSNTPQIFLM